MNFTSLFRASTLLGTVFSLCVYNVQAQSVHTVRADFGTRPSGANTNFSVNLTMTPADVNIAGFSFRVFYDNSQVTLLDATDNTGQPAANAAYTADGPEFADNSTTNVNVYKIVLMSTSENLINPTNLGQLQFKTTASYNDPYNRFWLRITDDRGEGLVDGTFTAIPTAFHGSDGDPQLVPVSLSGFSLD